MTGVGAMLAWLAACDAGTLASPCQVPGQLGAGAFTVEDCRGQAGCLDGWRFAARTVEKMVFCAADGQQVTEIVSTDPSVMVVSAPIVVGRDQVGFDLRAGEPGTTTIEVRGPDLLERLDLVVEELAAIDIELPLLIVEDGQAALTSTKTGVSGAPLFGRGGYDVTLPAGFTSRPATTATQDCELLQPDLVITAGAPGAYSLATAAPAPPWTATADVVAAAAVVSVSFIATRIYGNAAEGYAASVRVTGLAATNAPILGVACDWSSSRPVFIANNVCWSLILVATDEPLDLTCSFHGRVLGTAHLTNAIVL